MFHIPFIKFSSVNNAAERSCDIVVFNMVSISTQLVAAIKYCGITVGFRRTRVSVFIYVLPQDVPSRERGFTFLRTEHKSNTGCQHDLELQIGKRRLFGIEKISVSP